MSSTISEAMISRISQITALQLWEKDAIKVDLEQPFKLVSGNYSPIYVNCRVVISYPEFMQLFSTFAQIMCNHHGARFGTVAGSETAGIPFAAYLASSMNLPLVYVRKAPKDHGIASLVEGNLTANARVILVDDVVTDAGTKLKAIQSVSLSGGKVGDVLVVFDREQEGAEELKRNNIRLLALTSMSATLQTGNRLGILSSKNLEILTEYSSDPSAWHKKKGLPYH